MEAKLKVFFSQITPNYYSIRVHNLTFEIAVGKVVLPQGQENLLKGKQRIFAADSYTPGKIPAESIVWPNAVKKQDSYFNFYVPEGVTEFKFVVYYDAVVDDDSKILFQCNVKLNK